ncbi:hypothetical protein WHT83_16610 [Aminobacter sp. P9b]|uniref:hypothetical protein n=1 Tax=Aminobacter sp. P9b TaxID=3133697 RepID=UPI00324DDD12
MAEIAENRCHVVELQRKIRHQLAMMPGALARKVSCALPLLMSMPFRLVRGIVGAGWKRQLAAGASLKIGENLSDGQV